MIEYNQEEQGEIPDRSEFGVKVIGVGGAGANVLDRMALEGSDDAELLTLNTDVRALSTSVSSDKIQLGATLLKGMGTGGDPSLGKQAALEAVDEIREAVRGYEMIFVCVGLGGGTGSGAAPEVCRIAREEGIFLVVFATLPFSFEGERRMTQAMEALTTIGRYANAVIAFDNDRMGELIVPKDGVTQAFAAADKIISQSIRATMNVAFRPGIIRIGIDDLLSALDSSDSRCLFGYGVAKGDNRSHEAVEQALKCPLLDRGKLLNEAQAVLVQVAGGETMTLYEVQLVMEEVTKHVGSGTQILFGTGTDKRLSNSLSVTIISSIAGPNSKEREEVEESEPEPTVSLGMADAPVSPLAAAAEDDEYHEQVVEPDEGEEVQDFLQNDLPSETEEAPPEMADASEPEEAESAPEAEAEEGSAVFEPIEEPSAEERPAYAPEPIEPEESQSGETFPSWAEEDPSDDRNPIARALETPRDSGENYSQPVHEPMGENPSPVPPEDSAQNEDDPGADHVEAVTDSSQKIRLTRMLSKGNTGRIKTRDSKGDPGSGPALPPTKPPSMAGELESAEEPSEEARRQQEMLQLEPVAGKGRFAKTDPTIVDGEDLDVPTFLRKKK
ncbi:MAG: hypothetical protein WD342_19300 [Verrucomicrobiales bacterium]